MSEELYLRGLKITVPKESRADYVFKIPAISRIAAAGGLEFRAPITFLTGENGVGKSTLLEAVAIAWGFNPEGGTKNFTFASEETHGSLHRHLHLVRGSRRPRDGFFLRGESLYNIASEIDRIGELHPYYGGKSLHEQSHGESLLAIVLHRFGGGFYILDEPETALSATRQMTLLARIHQLAAAGSQFLIATHAPILLAMPGAEIFLLSDGGVSAIAYEESEAYAVTKAFLNHTDHMLEKLLGKDGEPPK